MNIAPTAGITRPHSCLKLGGQGANNKDKKGDVYGVREAYPPYPAPLSSLGPLVASQDPKSIIVLFEIVFRDCFGIIKETISYLKCLVNPNFSQQILKIAAFVAKFDKHVMDYLCPTVLLSFCKFIMTIVTLYNILNILILFISITK